MAVWQHWSCLVTYSLLTYMNYCSGVVCLMKMNNYIVRSYRDVIVITKFAIIKFATRRASKAQSIVMY